MTNFTEDECSKHNQLVEKIQKKILDFQRTLDKVKVLRLKEHALSSLNNQQESKKEPDCVVSYETYENGCEDEYEDGELDYESNSDEGKRCRNLD